MDKTMVTIVDLVDFIFANWPEVVGTIFGTIQPILASRNNVNNYLFGIVSVSLALWVYFNSKLYADFFLNFYYLIMSIYGWIYWRYGKQKNATPISTSTKNDYIKLSAIIIGAFVLMSFVLKNYTDSDVPYWDSLVSAFAWGGMWLMAKRKLENWIFLNISNLLLIPLLFYKSLYVYSGHTLLLFIIGCIGFLNWRKLLREAQEI